MNINLSRVWALVDLVENTVHRTLGSRKAIAALTGVVAGLEAHNLGLVAASVLTYIGVEGYVDSKSAPFAQAAPEAPAEDPAAAV